MQTMVNMPDGVALRTWTSGTASANRLPVALIHGGPGTPDCLAPVAGLIEDANLVHRYDQRGVGGPQWHGEHTIARHAEDFVALLDAWDHDRVILVGHSFGTNLACYFLLDHPARVAGLVLLAGPFLGEESSRAESAAAKARRSVDQQARFEVLGGQDLLTPEEDLEFLTLSWFPNHVDSDHAWQWAMSAARALGPVNLEMNQHLNAAKRADPLENHLTELRNAMPARAAIIGGSEDPRPISYLRHLGDRLGCTVTSIPDAGHEPWLEQPVLTGQALNASIERQQVFARAADGTRR